MSQRGAKFGQISEGAIPPIDKRANQEQKNIANSIKRNGEFDGVKHYIRMLFLIICSAIVVSVILCVVYNTLMPANSYFKSETQSKIREFLLESSIGGLIFDYFKKHVIDGSNGY